MTGDYIIIAIAVLCLIALLAGYLMFKRSEIDYSSYYSSDLKDKNLPCPAHQDIGKKDGVYTELDKDAIFNILNEITPVTLENVKGKRDYAFKTLILRNRVIRHITKELNEHYIILKK